MKKLTTRQVTQIKRTAQNVYPLVEKREKLLSKIETLKNEIDSISNEIDTWETAVLNLTGGISSTELIDKRITIKYNEDGYAKVDKKGQPVKEVRFTPNSNLMFNSEENVYTINYSCLTPPISKTNSAEAENTCDNHSEETSNI